MYDIIVIGGGHAGIEAALASARLNNKTLMLVGSISKIGHMPCNPSIGGPAKGIIVREIDALGGEMGIATDKTLLQMKMLNVSKGPAVRALRAQSDKVAYPRYMQNIVMNTENLEVREVYVTGLLSNDNSVYGVELETGEKIEAKAVIIASGTYLSSRILVGHTFHEAGPDEERTTTKLSESLKSLGVELIRLKTGTPPRIKTNSIDFSKTKPEPGDKKMYTFSETTESIRPFEEQSLCYLTHTTSETHKIIMDNLGKSSMYGGIVEGVGPRYCPSIEDKVVRFADKEQHQIFLEPESLEIDETYIQGFSTSMPHDVQELMVRSLPGLENAVFGKYAYAIEYDAINPLQLKNNLEMKNIENLFFAGQVNGTSGYEEAACQGLMAGINASLKIRNQNPFVLRRDEAYIGVLIDDLITKGVKDPYRMLTSRAEYRLLLRHDNANERLIEYGYKFGLINEKRYQNFVTKRNEIAHLKEKVIAITLTPKPEVNEYLSGLGKPVINTKVTGYDLLKRPDIDFDDLTSLTGTIFNESEKVKEQTLIEVKYEGYINKACREAEKLKQMETRKIPSNINYRDIPNIAHEALEKLEKVRPETLAQASRISGVNPSDITMILVYLEMNNGKFN